MGDARRAQRDFPSANDRLGNRDGEEEIGFADVVVIEEIDNVGAESIGVEDPAVERDGYAELMFFVALAVINEIVWRTQTTDFWVSFKLFGVVPLTFLFGALQYPLLVKYHPDAQN